MVGVACAGSERPATTDSVDPYAFLSSIGLSADSVRIAWAGLPLDSLRLTRSGCFGTCPVFATVLRRGGRATYCGVSYVDRLGVWEAHIGVGTYGRLTQLVDDARYRELKGEYFASWTDLETVVLTAWFADGSSKRVLDYGWQGPTYLWALHSAIEHSVAQADWRRLSDSIPGLARPLANDGWC